MYRIPKEYEFRIHHVRPRFKSNVENVLFYIASVCAGMGATSIEDYNQEIFNAIRLYTGNESKSDKTINNWRTEIAALFGFYIEDKCRGITKTGDISKILAHSGDLVQFFKYYLYKFQYPGGHLKSNYIKKLLDANIRFKPAQYILKLLHKADSHIGKPLGITKSEATHCIFNDLRVTRDNRNVEDVIDLICNNRRVKTKYDSRGDIIRYAGDILDYMVLANILKISHGYYYLNRIENEAISAFINNNEYFSAYNDLSPLKREKLSIITAIESQWFDYVNSNLNDQLFRTDITKYTSETEEEISEYNILIKDKINEVIISANTKEIGDLGEALIVGHEKARVKDGGREDLLHLIMKIPTLYAVGYDIQSVELDSIKRYIEVKTTISNKPLNHHSFHLTPNEWDAAMSLNDRYFVYRLMISKEELVIYILQDPVGMFKNDKLKLSLRNGAEITFKAENCEKTILKVWQN